MSRLTEEQIRYARETLAYRAPETMTAEDRCILLTLAAEEARAELEATHREYDRAIESLRAEFARYVLADWRRAGDDGCDGGLDKFLSNAEGVPVDVCELARREAKR
jgi:hypothetical protein